MFIAYYAKQMKLVDKALRGLIKTQISSVKGNQFLEYFYSKIEDFLFSGGKRIRPILMLTAFSAVKPENDNNDAVNTSLSLELLHNASLIHDDIMDNADTRRGNKAFHKVLHDYSQDKYTNSNIDYTNYGEAMGILGGDYVYNLAYTAILSDGFPSEIIIQAAKEFNEGFLRIVKGVIFESDLMGRRIVSETEYFEMITGKTASLFEKSARMGAILAEGSQSQIDLIGNFALNAGLAFQIVDDVIGTFGDPKKTGKPVDSDIKEGKKTLLVIKAYENANDEQKSILTECLGNSDLDKEKIEMVRDIIKETGALKYSQTKAEELFKESISYLEQCSPSLDEKHKKHLVEIAKLGVFREK